MSEETYCEFTESDFKASAIYTGENRLIEVTGHGDCPTSGWTLSLETDNAGINPDPTVLVLKVKHVPPEPGSAVLDVITPVQVSAVFDAEQEVNTVLIRAGSSEFHLEVEEPV